MITSFKRNLWQVVFFAVAGLLLLFMFIKAQPVNTERHNLLTSDLRELQARDIELSANVLQHHFQLFHNYDGVVATMQHMQDLGVTLSQHLQNGLLPDTPETRQELNDIKRLIGLKTAALEEFKSSNAVSKTALIYLPTTVEKIEQQLRKTNSLHHDMFSRLLKDALLAITNQSNKASESLAQAIDAIDRAIPDLPESVRSLTTLSLRHARNILESEDRIENLIFQLSSPGKSHLGMNLEKLYLDYYQQQQASASRYRLFLLLAAMLVLAYAFYAYYEMLEKNEQLRVAATAFDTQESLIITDANGVIQRVNQVFTESTGYSAEEAVGQTPRLLRSGRHDNDFYRDMWESIKRTGAWQGEIWDRRKNGEIYPSWLSISAVKESDGLVTHYVGSHLDITDRKAAEEKIQRLAFYDPLTGLPNRRLLMDRIGQALSSSVRSGQQGALLFIDLDNFKTLNDTLGHAVGDSLLHQVAQRLTSCVRGDDTVARIGGDEFVVVLSELGKQAFEAAEQAEIIGEKILTSLNQPYQLATSVHHSTASIGINLFNGHQSSQDELMKQSDIAMYQAKKAGRNTLRFFDHQMQSTINAHAALEAELHQALASQQFCMYYQIQVDSNDQPLGAEGLIRWHHPERGLVSPLEFISLAEESELIVQIGLWVLKAACAQLKQWQNNPMTSDLTLAVNVSARQFRQTDFVEEVKIALLESGANASRLKLELTESTVLKNVEDTISKMHELKALGVSFSMDDFGTGYSSLQYLKRLPLNQIKIDQSFVRDITTDHNDAAIVHTIIAMTEALGLNVIAEGVETKAQQAFLDSHGCHAFQGYLFGEPVPVEQFKALLRLDETLMV